MQKKDGVKVHRLVKMRMEAEYEDSPGVKYIRRGCLRSSLLGWNEVGLQLAASGGANIVSL